MSRATVENHRFISTNRNRKKKIPKSSKRNIHRYLLHRANGVVTDLGPLDSSDRIPALAAAGTVEIDPRVLNRRMDRQDLPETSLSRRQGNPAGRKAPPARTGYPRETGCEAKGRAKREDFCAVPRPPACVRKSLCIPFSNRSLHHLERQKSRARTSSGGRHGRDAKINDNWHKFK